MQNTFEKEDSKPLMLLVSSIKKKKEHDMHIIAHMAPKASESKTCRSPFLILLSCMLALVI